MRAVRGNEIGMIFQEPMSSLNPLLTVGEQIAEVVRLDQGLGRTAARHHAVDDAGAREYPRSHAARRRIPAPAVGWLVAFIMA